MVYPSENHGLWEIAKHPLCLQYKSLFSIIRWEYYALQEISKHPHSSSTNHCPFSIFRWEYYVGLEIAKHPLSTLTWLPGTWTNYACLQTAFNLCPVFGFWFAHVLPDFLDSYLSLLRIDALNRETWKSKTATRNPKEPLNANRMKLGRRFLFKYESIHEKRRYSDYPRATLLIYKYVISIKVCHRSKSSQPAIILSLLLTPYCLFTYLQNHY